ncbi:MAG: DNA integrity scanning diadenylate cyclase DisA [Micrococcales bacterium]|nr:DNA integrity scanning diadenylate cyclase DisA [Micrococcales bacterium]
MAQDEFDQTSGNLLLTTLSAVAPGTELRDGLERILRGRTGALIVLGFDPSVEAMCSGGFVLDVPFSATRLRELSKMDGALVVDYQAGRIVRAAVQLLPDPSITTTESGTRHRTAERVAKQTSFPVLAVSQSENIVTLYVSSISHPLEDPEKLASRTKQALTTLERYRDRLDEVSATLSGLEIEDVVTVRDVATVAGRQEMVWRIAEEVAGLLAELGVNGRLLRLQFEELIAGVDTGRSLLISDYVDLGGSGRSVGEVTADLSKVSPTNLMEAGTVAQVLGLAETANQVDAPLSPKGHRMLSRVPRLPPAIADRIASHFGSLQNILAATLADLMGVEGVGELRARAVREGLSRIAESSVIDRLS